MAKINITIDKTLLLRPFTIQVQIDITTLEDVKLLNNSATSFQEYDNVDDLYRDLLTALSSKISQL